MRVLYPKCAYAWSILLMKSDLKWCIHLDLFFIFQPFHSLGECHCWWTRESLRAHAAKFNGWLQLIRSVSRASTFSVLKFIEIVMFVVYSPSLLASVCFGTFVISLFNFFSYFVCLRITDDSSVLEMCIWSILLSLFPYCKIQAFTLNTLCGFCKIYAKNTFFVLARGGGVNSNISSSLYFHFVIKFRLLLSICGLHFWCPLNLKMLPTPLLLTNSLYVSWCLTLWSGQLVGRGGRGVVPLRNGVGCFIEDIQNVRNIKKKFHSVTQSKSIWWSKPGQMSQGSLWSKGREKAFGHRLTPSSPFEKSFKV